MTTADQNAVKEILTSSPPGQFDQILASLRSIIPKSKETELLEADFIATLRSEWEASTGRVVLAAVSNYEGEDPTSTNDNCDECMKSLQKSMNLYLSQKFSSPGIQSAHKIERETEGNTNSPITITTYAERIDLHNHNAGSWTGKYTINTASNEISGNVVICAHTFENGGNFQLHSTMRMDPIVLKTTYNDQNSTSWAKAAVDQIGRFEEKQIMEKLSEMYDSMSSVHLKSLRRVMPVTRMKMEWNVMAHRLVHTLGEGHGKNM